MSRPWYVRVRDRQSGRVVLAPVRDHHPEHGPEAFVYWWTLGNFGCDCNRCTLFGMEAGAVPCNRTASSARFELLEMVRVVGPGWRGIPHDFASLEVAR